MVSHNTYFKALLWLGLSMVVSCINDAVTKFLTIDLAAFQVCFFRFVWGSIVLLPLMYYRSHLFQTTRLWLHFLRGALLAIAMGLYAYALAHIAMGTVTVIGFTNPIFVLILARIFLKEPVRWPLWVATWVAFIGIAFMVRPGMMICYAPLLGCVIATVIFAVLDILNKKYIVKEPMVAMVFYSNMMAAFCAIPMAWSCWQSPTVTQMKVLAILGIGGNLILYCLLRALSLADAAALAPVKYMELVLSVLFGYLFFREWPTCSTYLGALLIIASTLFVAYYRRQ